MSTMDLYPWLKVVHILLAIAAVGSNLTYGIWQARAGREPEHMGYALRGIKFLDDRVANPAYVGLLVVGVVLVFIGPYEFEAAWIVVSIVLYVLLAATGIGLFSPTLRAQIAAFEANGAGTPEFARLTARSRMLGVVMAVMVIAIIWLMAAKPGAA